MRQQLDQIRGQLGWQGVSGISLLILAWIFQMLSLNPLEQETAFMHSRLDAVHSKASRETRTFDSADRQKELGDFFDSLPAEADVTDILGSIYSIAEAAGVEIKEADFHLDDKDRPRVEYGMNFPVRGDYARIRVFLSRVLADHPALALDQIDFQRDRVDEAVLKAEIRLTLFLNPSR